MKIALTNVYVTDPMKAHKFYTEVLGFASKIHIPDAYLAIIASAEDMNGTRLLLEPNKNPIAKAYQEGLYNAGLPAIVLSTEDIQQEYERLNDLNIIFRKPPTKTDWGIDAVFEDGFGNLIQLFQLGSI